MVPRGIRNKTCGLHILFSNTLRKMDLDITSKLTLSKSPFYTIVPWDAVVPLGHVLASYFWDT
jgi:hypothetical protein